MSRNIKTTVRYRKLINIDFRINVILYFVEGASYDLTTRCNYHRVSRIYPVLVIRIQPFTLGKVLWNIVATCGNTCADYPAATFTGNMLHCANPTITAIVGWCNVDVDALRIHRKAR